MTTLSFEWYTFHPRQPTNIRYIYFRTQQSFWLSIIPNRISGIIFTVDQLFIGWHVSVSLYLIHMLSSPFIPRIIKLENMRSNMNIFSALEQTTQLINVERERCRVFDCSCSNKSLYTIKFSWKFWRWFSHSHIIMIQWPTMAWLLHEWWGALIQTVWLIGLTNP